MQPNFSDANYLLFLFVFYDHTYKLHILTARSVSSEEGGERHFRLPSVVGGESRPDPDIRAIWREINELTIVLAEKRRLFATIASVMTLNS